MTTCNLTAKIVDLYDAYDSLSYRCNLSITEIPNFLDLCGESGNGFSLVREIYNLGTQAIQDGLNRAASSYPGYPGPVPTCLDGDYIIALADFFRNIDCSEYYSLGVCEKDLEDLVNYVRNPANPRFGYTWVDCGRYFLPGTYTVRYVRGAILWATSLFHGTAIEANRKWFLSGQSCASSYGFVKLVAVPQDGSATTVYNFLGIGNKLGQQSTNENDNATYYSNKTTTITITRHSKIGVYMEIDLAAPSRNVVAIPDTTPRYIGSVQKTVPNIPPFTIRVDPCFCNDADVVTGPDGNLYCKDFCPSKIGYFGCVPGFSMYPINYDWTYPNNYGWISWYAENMKCWTSFVFKYKEFIPNTNMWGSPCEKCSPEPSNGAIYPCNEIDMGLAIPNGSDWSNSCTRNCREQLSSGATVSPTFYYYQSVAPYPTTVSWLITALEVGKSYCVELDLNWKKRDPSVCGWIGDYEQDMKYINCLVPECPSNTPLTARAWFSAYNGYSWFTNGDSCPSMGTVPWNTSPNNVYRVVGINYQYAKKVRVYAYGGGYVCYNGVCNNYYIDINVPVVNSSSVNTLYAIVAWWEYASYFDCEDWNYGFDIHVDAYDICGKPGIQSGNSCARYTKQGRPPYWVACSGLWIASFNNNKRSTTCPGGHYWSMVTGTISICTSRNPSGGCCGRVNIENGGWVVGYGDGVNVDVVRVGSGSIINNVIQNPLANFCVPNQYISRTYICCGSGCQSGSQLF